MSGLDLLVVLFYFAISFSLALWGARTKKPFLKDYFLSAQSVLRGLVLFLSCVGIGGVLLY